MRPTHLAALSPIPLLKAGQTGGSAGPWPKDPIARFSRSAGFHWYGTWILP